MSKLQALSALDPLYLKFLDLAAPVSAQLNPGCYLFMPATACA